MPLSRGLDVGLIEWTEKHWHGSKDPQDSAKSSIRRWSTSLEQSQASTYDVGATEGRGAPEGGRPAYPRAAGLVTVCVKTKQLSPTPGMNQERPGEGGGQTATILGPGLGGAGRPHLAAAHFQASRGS